MTPSSLPLHPLPPTPPNHPAQVAFVSGSTSVSGSKRYSPAGSAGTRTRVSGYFGFPCWETLSWCFCFIFFLHANKCVFPLFSFTLLPCNINQLQNLTFQASPWRERQGLSHHFPWGCLCIWGCNTKEAQFRIESLFLFPQGGLGRGGLGLGRDFILPPRICYATKAALHSPWVPHYEMIFSICIRCNCFANLLSLGIIKRNEMPCSCLE